MPPGPQQPPLTQQRSTLGTRNPALVGMVRSRFANDASWRYFANDGRWICPFCLTTVAKRQGLSHEASCASHLERCSAFANGTGTQRPEADIAQCLRLEQVTQMAHVDPAWRVYDHEGVWYCPGCLERIPAVKLSKTQITGFTTRAMTDHVAGCTPLLQGALHDDGAVQRSRDRIVRLLEMETAVRSQISFPSWRYATRGGGWICPCCLASVGNVQLTKATATNAVRGMAQHLAEECPAVAAAKRIEPRGEDDVRDAALRAQPNPTTTTRFPRHLESSKVVPPQRTPLHSAATRNGSSSATPAQPERAANRTPGRAAEVVTPASGPMPAPEAFAWMDSVERQATPAVPVPIAAESERTPAIQVPERTTAPSDSDGKDLNWMDQAEHREDDDSAQQESTEDALERTDVMRAKDLQEEMMADSPEIDGWRFATRFQACSQVSGDFYEFMRLPDGRVGFAIGDVSGHGVQAGLIMSMAKKTLEIFAGTGLGPADVIARVNEAIARDLGGKLFVSMCYGVLDTERGTITWARAGHTPPVHYHAADNSITEIKPKGMVVGMKTGPAFRNLMTEETIQVNPGDAILLYTDGISESMNRQREEFGTERLFALIRSVPVTDPERLLDEILNRARHFRGGPADDDLTLLVVVRDP